MQYIISNTISTIRQANCLLLYPTQHCGLKLLAAKAPGVKQFVKNFIIHAPYFDGWAKEIVNTLVIRQKILESKFRLLKN